VAQPKGPLYYTTIALGLVSTIAVTILVTRIAKKAIEQELHLTEVNSEE
jgi:hypothetical protein